MYSILTVMYNIKNIAIYNCSIEKPIKQWQPIPLTSNMCCIVESQLICNINYSYMVIIVVNKLWDL